MSDMASTIGRRQLFVASAGAALASLAPPAWAQAGFPSERWVNIVFTPTGERYADRYFWDGVYSMAAVRQFSWTCRDFHVNEWKWIHPWLMDLVFVLHWKYNKNLISIFSGYRSPQTNAHIEGAALDSQHTRAMALDIHIPEVDNEAVARDLKQIIYGGTGIYPGRGFTHFDFGPLRSWVG
jgi:uncharacterized protein YcbK (DUF882 family)